MPELSRKWPRRTGACSFTSDSTDVALIQSSFLDLRIWTVSLADLLYPIHSHGCASDPDKDPVMEKDGRLPPQSNGGRSYRRQTTYHIRSLICESSSPARPAWLVVEPFPFWWPRDTE